jgi:integrase
MWCTVGTARLLSDDRLKKAEAYRGEFASAGLPRSILVNDREPLVISRPQRQHQAPTYRELFEHGRPVRKAAALTLPMLRQLLATCDASSRGRRDRALLLFGFAGALHRSELAALRVENVAVVGGGAGQGSAGGASGIASGGGCSCASAWERPIRRAKRKAGPLV